MKQASADLVGFGVEAITMAWFKKSRSALGKSARRREELRRHLPKPGLNLRGLIERPEVINGAVILMGFVIVATALVLWGIDQAKVTRGQIMTGTRLSRLAFAVEDVQKTKANQEEARKSSPRIYRLNESYLDRLEAALIGLPQALAGKITVEEVTHDLRLEFSLTDETALRVVKAHAAGGEPTPQWRNWVSRLIREQLVRRPLLDSEEFQRFSTTANKALLLPSGEKDAAAFRGDAIELRHEVEPGMNLPLMELVMRASFPEEVAKYIAARLQHESQPTILFDNAETERVRELAANRVPPVVISHEKGELLYSRGETLSAEQYTEILTEMERFAGQASFQEIWLPRLGLAGLIALMAGFVGAHVGIAYPRITRNPLRMIAVALLMAAMLAVSIGITVTTPIFLYPAAIGPTLIVAIVVLLAYDQRLAMLIAAVQSALVVMALEQSLGCFVLLMVGCGTIIAQLREVRHRNSLIKAATMTAGVLGAGMLLLGLLELPKVDGAWKQAMVMAFSAVLTCYGISFLVLGILPSIERLFDITTGMTLAELRDPKRPLLRQLQQKAPGTYNHSLQVANIAEAAADAIGGDSLLVYVGALYHDIGKMNKPEYFVENQAGGQNKHEKLSPAMSLLVIVGHVKDGIELAREYSLPRSIQHFIESHHGTTLVEYFYHAAKTRAEESENAAPVAEIEYRYPGPRPRTKEAAILMLADAVESSARAMAEPNPGRIENLVRKLSRKRLDDGQFNECSLTLRELTLIEDAIINRMLAIYHSRITYPTGATTTRGDSGESPRSAVKTISA